MRVENWLGSRGKRPASSMQVGAGCLRVWSAGPSGSGRRWWRVLQLAPWGYGRSQGGSLDRPSQMPGDCPAAAAAVASRTKRTTFPARERISPRIWAVALFARPYQGERVRSRRDWLALRLSA